MPGIDGLPLKKDLGDTVGICGSIVEEKFVVDPS
jgi:hypothetical protein